MLKYLNKRLIFVYVYRRPTMNCRARYMEKHSVKKISKCAYNLPKLLVSLYFNFFQGSRKK